MGEVLNKTHAQAPQTSRKKAACSFTYKLELIAVLGTIYYKIPQEHLKSKKSIIIIKMITMNALAVQNSHERQLILLEANCCRISELFCYQMSSDSCETATVSYREEKLS